MGKERQDKQHEAGTHTDGRLLCGLIEQRHTEHLEKHPRSANPQSQSALAFITHSCSMDQSVCCKTIQKSILRWAYRKMIGCCNLWKIVCDSTHLINVN